MTIDLKGKNAPSGIAGEDPDVTSAKAKPMC